jgi:hypothetical protein
LLLQLHFCNLIHFPFRACLQEIWLCHILPGSSGFLLKSEWKPPWPNYLHFACLQSQHQVDNAKVYCQLTQ